MRIIRDITELAPDQPTALTIGNFDGVHRGHQYLIRSVVERAEAAGLQSAVMTFDPHTDHVLHPERDRLLLTSLEERAALIAELGVQLLLVLEFSPAVAALSAEAFMRRLCDHLRLAELWDGPDFRLGHKAQGSMAVLAELGQRLGYHVEVVEPVAFEGQRVSSTQIRAQVERGAVAEARRALGRHFSLQGPVVQGDQRGRTIGVPTANLAIPASHVLPADGVYACWARLPDRPQQRLAAVTNIGVRPTFSAPDRTVEAHLLNFSADLYGQTLILEFVERLRGEQRFAGVQALVEQIARDRQRAQELLDKQNQT